MEKTMRAAVMRIPGGPDVLKIGRRPVSIVSAGQTLIRIGAFG